MSGRTKFSLAIAAVAVAAVVVVAAPKLDLGDGGGDPDSAAGTRAPQPEPERAEPEQPAQERPAPERRAKPPPPPAAAPPADPDAVKGNEERALTRPANLRRALAVLERRRRAMEGVFDGLRIAPGRIDTVVETRDKRLNLQVRTDFKIAFSSQSDFPNRPDYRRYGITGRDVDVRGPARILRRIDRVREGSAARDVDYVIVRRDIIDFKVNIAAYLRSGPPPRIFSDEADAPFRAIG